MIDGHPWAEAQVTITDDKGTRTVSTAGDPEMTAAWLRAVADKLSPPKPKQPVMRGES
jgi:hypothetical protein